MYKCSFDFRIASHQEAPAPAPWRSSRPDGSMKPPEPAEPPVVTSGAATAGVPLMTATPKMMGYKGSGKGKDHGYYWEDQQGGWHWYQPVTWMHWVLCAYVSMH